MEIDLIKIFLPAVLAFGVGITLTPFLSNLLYKSKAWKKKSGKTLFNGQKAEIFNSLHKEREVNTPRMGGLVIWISAAVTIIGIWIISVIFPEDLLVKLDFLSRSQTWIPLSTLVLGGAVGFFDDLLEVRAGGGGLSLRYRLSVVGVLGILAGWWFYEKLEITTLGLPAVMGGGLEIGWLIVPLFSLVAIAIYSGGIIDGLDGLAGGVFAAIFSSYAIMAFYLGQINLAAFCTMLVGAICAFLWFNIPPARFYMSETGTMALTLTLTVVAFLSDSLGGGYGVSVLPIIAFPLFATSASAILQIFSKKFFNRKIFKIAPLHHHFEAIGWPAYKVVMRFWIISAMFAIVGTILAVVGL